MAYVAAFFSTVKQLVGWMRLSKSYLSNLNYDKTGLVAKEQYEILGCVIWGDTFFTR